jgi:site-specific DNA recombinase
MSEAVVATDHGALAVTYLRVSTKEQAERDGDPEGYSIPAQREANRRKAEQLSATIVAEFVDRGESARSANRPQLQALLEYVRQHRVAYVIVHKVDRLARNRFDDVEINLALTQAGVTLVSATESIDETPSGMLLHGIMSSIPEFYSRNLATEVIKGMSQKAKGGGTIGRAPIGYRHGRTINPVGRELRTVEIDPERAPLIRWAFEAFATGDWTASQLNAELTRRGLTSRATPKHPSKPLNDNQINAMLHRAYYRGAVTYNGAEYAGRHEPLVTPETWYRVQAILESHRFGEKQRTHNQYLKSSVFCGQCGSRLSVQLTRKPEGKSYRYFICLGRSRKRTGCTSRAVLTSTVEQEVVEVYRSIQLSPDLRNEVESKLLAALRRSSADRDDERETLQRRIDEIKRQQAKLLQAHYADAIPLDLLGTEQERLGRERTDIEDKLRNMTADHQRIEDKLSVALDLAQDCARAYRDAPPRVRRMFNQALFTRLLVMEDHTEGELGEPFRTLIEQSKTTSADADIIELRPSKDTFRHTEDDLGDWEQGGPSSENEALVPPTGFEPVLPP